MDQELARRLPEVVALCRRHRVGRLDVFGSAARQAEGAADLIFPETMHGRHILL
jgi:predicted nucleotidyltransferase